MRGVTSQYRDRYLEKMQDERVARGTDEVQIESKKVYVKCIPMLKAVWKD
jgi:hypothetical protein